MKRKACVIGAGPIGLGTALNLVQTLPDLEVTLIAELFSPHTTGDVAAGLICPYALLDTPPPRINQWMSATQDHAQHLYFSSEARESGTQYMPVLDLFREKEEDPPWKDLVDGFRRLTPRELAAYSPSLKLVDGWMFSSYMIECIRYLPWTMKKFRNLGGNIVSTKVADVKELYDNFDIVINCTGLGSHHLVRDTSLQPIRGQIIRVKAPWIKHFITIGDVYIGPGADSVVLGGTHQTGNWNDAVDDKDGRDIWRQCTELMPSLHRAEVLSHQVGLRPARQTVRLESELVTHGGKKVLLVHNYGHGGSGVTLHWGCAQEATELVREGVDQLNPPPAKL